MNLREFSTAVIRSRFSSSLHEVILFVQDQDPHLRGAKSYSRLLRIAAANPSIEEAVAMVRGAELRWFVGAVMRTFKWVEADLSGVDFSGINMEGAKLASASLKGANLKNAYMVGVDLSSANLENADLSGACLRYADLHDIDLSNACLKDADLREANLVGADFADADVTGTLLDSSESH